MLCMFKIMAPLVMFLSLLFRGFVVLLSLRRIRTFPQQTPSISLSRPNRAILQAHVHLFKEEEKATDRAGLNFRCVARFSYQVVTPVVIPVLHFYAIAFSYCPTHSLLFVLFCQLRMKASKEREHRQNHAGEEDNGSLQPSPIVRPSSAKGICTPPRKLAGAGTRNIQVREFSPDSSSPPSFRGVSAAREFQAAIRRDVLFLEQQHHTSSNSSSNSTSIGPSNVMRTRTRSTSSASSTSSSSSSSSGRSEAREFVRHDGRFIGKDGIVIAPGVRLVFFLVLCIASSFMFVFVLKVLVFHAITCFFYDFLMRGK